MSRSPANPVSYLPTAGFFSLALLSGGSLFLEITLTRLFSTLFYPPYVFAIISLAVLGIGLGAALAAWQTPWRSVTRLPRYLALTGATVVGLLLLALWTAPYDLRGGLLALVPLPYFFVGLSLATFFSATPGDSPRLYQIDLLGAGAGVLLAIPALNVLGSINGLLLAAMVFGAAALLMTVTTAASNAARYFPALVVGVSLLLLLSNHFATWLDVPMARLSAAKPMTESLARGGQIIATQWDAFARTDLVDPGGGKPYELYIDGAAGSVMPPVGDNTLLQTDIGFFPFALQRPAQAMVIGPGGGLDVWFALRGGAQQITAVEINPASVQLVNQFAPYHGDLYGQPGVRLLVDEGRSVLRREATTYDVIYLSQVVTLAAERSGYALTENTVYTVEAFQEYLAHLKPGGQIALKLYDELTLSRAMITAITALSQHQGITEAEAMGHIAIFLDPDADPPVPLLLVQNQPFSRDDGLAYAGVAVEVGFVPLFVPHVTSSNPALEAVLTGSNTLADIIAASTSDLSPTTDDHPFFYQFEPTLPTMLRPLLGGLGVVLLLGLGGLVVTQRKYNSRLEQYAPLYFAALGIGFMLLEITIIQQTRLFLGHPTPAVTTVLATLLLGGGLGSGWAGRWPAAKQNRRLPVTIAAIAGGALLWLVAWPWLSQAFLGASIGLRMAIVVAALSPLALLLGIPFPLGLRAVGQFEAGERHVALAWAVNGVMTVAGSVLAMTVAMLAGFTAVLLVGVGAYLLAAILGLKLY